MANPKKKKDEEVIHADKFTWKSQDVTVRPATAEELAQAEAINGAPLSPKKGTP